MALEFRDEAEKRDHLRNVFPNQQHEFLVTHAASGNSLKSLEAVSSRFRGNPFHDFIMSQN